MVAEAVEVAEVTVVLEVLAVQAVQAVTETMRYIVADIVVLLMVMEDTSMLVGIVPEVMVDKADMVDTIKAIINLFLQIIAIIYVIPV